jgi:hypothetical protein
LLFGVRHRRAFRFISHRGRLIDAVIGLQGKGAFPKDCFQGVDWKKDESLFTVKGEEGLLVQFGFDGFILTCDITKNDTITPNALAEMAQAVAESTFEIAEVGENIDRLGMIHEFVFPRDGKAASELKDLLVPIPFDDHGVVEGLQLRTTLRYGETKSVTSSKSSDYKNVIITGASRKAKDLPHEKPEDILIAVDFQMCFDPARKLSQIQIPKHVESAVAFCNKLKNGSLKTLKAEA